MYVKKNLYTKGIVLVSGAENAGGQVSSAGRVHFLRERTNTIKNLL